MTIALWGGTRVRIASVPDAIRAADVSRFEAERRCRCWTNVARMALLQAAINPM